MCKGTYSTSSISLLLLFFFQGNIDFFKEVFFFNVDHFYSLY